MNKKPKCSTAIKPTFNATENSGTPQLVVNSAKSPKKLELDNGSESYASYEDNEIGGCKISEYNRTGSNAIKTPPEKSEESMIEEMLARLAGFSDSGKTKLVNALFTKHINSGAPSFGVLAFERLHNTFHCQRLAESQNNAKSLCAERTGLQRDVQRITESRRELAKRTHSADTALTQANYNLAQMQSALNEANFATQNEKQRAQGIQERAERDMKEFRTQIEDLSNLHVRSVNAIAPGIEPISDQTFRKALTDHHTKTYQWCRWNFSSGGRKLGETYGKLSAPLKARLDSQCHSDEIGSLPVSRAADLVLWTVLHDYVMRPPFPINIPSLSIPDWGSIQMFFGHNGTLIWSPLRYKVQAPMHA